MVHEVFIKRWVRWGTMCLYRDGSDGARSVYKEMGQMVHDVFIKR